MSTQIRDMFNELCKELVFDQALLKKVNAFRIGFLTRNEAHIRFFGGNLTGVETVRFTPADEDHWCDQILQTSVFTIEAELHKLSVIIPSFKVSSDPLNNSFVWMMHRFLNSPNLSAQDRYAGAFEVCMIMNYRYLTSRLYRHFKFPADPDVAAATYASLSRKFALKYYGNWTRTLEARCRDILDSNGNDFRRVLHRMQNDIEVRKMLNDTQGRIRSMMKNIFNAHLEAHKRGARISSSSSFITHEDDVILKDRTGGFAQHYRYLLGIVSDPASFIKRDLAAIICKIMPTMPDHHFITTLNWISKQTTHSTYSVQIERLVTDTIIHAYNYLYDRRNELISQSDIAGSLGRLKGAYGASHGSNPLLVEIRELAEQFVAKATGTRHRGNISAVRTGVLLYLVARSMTRKHYAG